VVTVTSQRGVAVDSDLPIATGMLDFSALIRPYDPLITVNNAVSQGPGRDSCLGQGYASRGTRSGEEGTDSGVTDERALLSLIRPRVGFQYK
jgi:hypothetical protein